MSVRFFHDNHYAHVTYPYIQLFKIIDGGNLTKDCEERERERENQQDATIRCLLSTLSQHVSGIILPIFRKTKTVCYCMRCAAL